MVFIKTSKQWNRKSIIPISPLQRIIIIGIFFFILFFMVYQQLLQPSERLYDDSTQMMGSFRSPPIPKVQSPSMKMPSLVAPPMGTPTASPVVDTPQTDNHSTGTTGHPIMEESENNYYEVLCMNDNAYGQTFNMILTISAARTIAYELTKSKSNNTNGIASTSTNTSLPTLVKVGLGPFFSDFFDATLEPQDDIILYYYSENSGPDEKKCNYIYRTMELFYSFFELNWNIDSRVQHIQSLIPKESIRDQAMSYLQKLKKSTDTNTNINNNAIITTVHRRNFEDTCHSIIQNRNNVACLDLHTGNKKPSIEFFSDNDLTNLCNRNYAMILADLNITNIDSSNHIILLCSDRQVSEYDSTFPHLVSIIPENVPDMENNVNYKPIMIEAWIMTLSDIHYGIPMSTVDVVVQFWRNGPFLQQHPVPWQLNPNVQREMRPQSCYGSSSAYRTPQ